MDKKEVALNGARLGKEVVSSEHVPNIDRFRALDCKMIVENSAPVVVGMLMERVMQNLDSPDRDDRHEAMALAREFLPFMLKKKGIEKELEPNKGGGISDALLARIGSAVGRDLTGDDDGTT